MTDEERVVLEERAALVRRRMLAKVDVLGQRKTAVVTAVRQARVVTRPLVLGVAIAAVGAATGVGAWALVKKRRERARRIEWLGPLRELFRPPPPSLASALTKRILLGGAGALSSQLVTWAAKEVLPPAVRPAGERPVDPAGPAVGDPSVGDRRSTD